jgi:acetyl esterase
MFDPVEARRIGNANAVKAPPDAALESIEVTVPSLEATHDISCRLYRPALRTLSLPLVVFFHGGGWTLGDLDTHDVLCRRLVRAADVVVLAVAYRLAPEFPYPAALNDGWSVVTWAHKNAATLGASESMLVVAGDSSGANISAAVALLARDRGGPDLATQMLVYPPLDARCDSESYRERADDGGTITLSQMQWFWSQYIGSADPSDPLISPIHADLQGLPPTLVVAAGFDPLRDDARAFAARLESAGVDVHLEEYERTFHGFLSFEVLAEAADALQRMAEWIGRWRRDWTADP